MFDVTVLAKHVAPSLKESANNFISSLSFQIRPIICSWNLVIERISLNLIALLRNSFCNFNCLDCDSKEWRGAKAIYWPRLLELSPISQPNGFWQPMDLSDILKLWDFSKACLHSTSSTNTNSNSFFISTLLLMLTFDMKSQKLYFVKW